MTRIIHLSDLHFGAHEPDLIDPLLAAVDAAHADLIVVSGDLAHRGTPGQFRLAEAFLDRLEGPVLCVPGNHDLPHWSPLMRVFAPYRRFQSAAGPEMAPVWQNADTLAAGINTADRWQWKRGYVSDAQRTRLSETFSTAGDRNRVLVMHHPLEHAALSVDPLMHGAKDTLATLTKAGVQVVLSGHVHVSYSGPFRDAPGVLFVQAGTALSTRRRGEANGFTLLDLRDDHAQVSVHRAGRSGFEPGVVDDFQRLDGQWQHLPRWAA